jgi:hypothetical protein
MLSLGCNILWAQTSTLKTVKRKRNAPPITQEFSMGARLNTDGWSAFAERGFIKPDEGKTQFIWFDISEKKHPKEVKQLNEIFSALNPNQPAPLPFKYGKINNFYQMKIGYGQKKVLTGKLDKKSIIVSWVYGAGLSLGFIKPYHLDIAVPEGNNMFSRQVVDYYNLSTQEYFNDENFIIGGTYFTEGINKLSLVPGVLAKSGFYFDYAPYRKSLLGIEIGTSMELYPRDIPLMANTNNNFYFFNFYVDVRFGKRWSVEN